MRRNLLFIIILILNIAWGQISVDRTRVIFNQQQQNTQSLILTNHAKTPFLAQVWIENIEGEKILTPIVALPILQRVDPGEAKHIKIQLMTQATAKLPNDRESLFYLNILSVPPKEEGSGLEVSIAVQLKIKLFYRPKGLAQFSQDNRWLRSLEIYKNAKSLTISNPTGYHAVIYGLQSGADNFDKDIIIEPFSTEVININLSRKDIAIRFVSDGGGTLIQHYLCGSEQKCHLEKVEIETMDGVKAVD